MSSWCLSNEGLLVKSLFRSVGVFRAQDSGQLHVYANTAENETLSPAFQVHAAFQTVLKPSDWFILFSPFQIELSAEPDLCELYTSSAEIEDLILPAALAIRVFATQ